MVQRDTMVLMVMFMQEEFVVDVDFEDLIRSVVVQMKELCGGLGSIQS